MHVAPQFWRFTPALALLTAPLFVAFAFLFSEALSMVPGFDWGAFRFAAIGAVLAAGVAFYQAPRIDRITAVAVIAAACCVNWCVFLISGQYGAGVAFIELLIALLWLFALAAIFGAAYAHLRWLRWVALTVLTIATLLCAAWLVHELIFTYWPKIWTAITTPPLN